MRSWRLVGIVDDPGDRREVLGVTQSGIAVEGVDRREASVAGSGRVVAALLEVGQESRRSAARRGRRGPVGMAACRSVARRTRAAAERVAVGGDGARTDVPLGDQPVGEERLERRREQAHDRSPRRVRAGRARARAALGRLADTSRWRRGRRAEERREQRQLGVDVLAGLIPADQRADSERVPEVVRAGADPLAGSLQPDCPISFANGLLNAPAVSRDPAARRRTPASWASVGGGRAAGRTRVARS